MADTDALAAFLRKVPLLQGIPDQAVTQIARRAPPPRSFKPDSRAPEAAAIYLADAPATALYIVLDEAGGRPDARSGTAGQAVVQVSVEEDKLTTRVRLWRVYPRQYFGELEYLARSETGRFPMRLTRAVALSACRILELPFKLVDELVEQHPIVFRRLTRQVIGRFQETLEETLANKVSDPDIALANWVLERARDFGIRQGNLVRFRTAISQENIGRDLGVTRETISLRLSEWRRRGLIASARGSQFVVRDMERVERIAALAIERSRNEHGDAVTSVDDALARGDNFRARNFALDLLNYFPGSIVLKHRAVLAVARCGATHAALGLLEHFGFGPDVTPAVVQHRVRVGVADPIQAPKAHYDTFDLDEVDQSLTEFGEKPKVAELAEDILALAPRLWKDVAFAGKELDRQAAERAYEGYCKAFAASTRPYTGINAASLAFMIGRPQEGLAHARQVLKRLLDPRTYWDLATKSEALLLSGDATTAAEILRSAMQCADASEGSIAATRLQLSRLAESGIPGARDILDALPWPTVAVVAGPVSRSSDAIATEDEETLGNAVRQIIRERRIGHIYSALAAGADVVIAETALAEGCHVHVVLPVPVEDYIAAAVPHTWKDRFERGIERAASLTAPQQRSAPARASTFIHGHRQAAGQAVFKAAALTAPCLLIAVGGEAPGGTHHARLARDWQAAGREVVLLPFGSGTAPADSGDAGWRPVISTWLSAPNSKQVSARGLPEESIAAAESVVRSTVDAGTLVARRDLGGNRPQSALVAIPKDLQSAIDTANHLLHASWPKEIAVQITLDFGPALATGGKLHEQRFRELDTGAGPLEVPDGTLVASASFAMEARLASTGAHSIVALGRVARLVSPGRVMLLPSTEIYALYPSAT